MSGFKPLTNLHKAAIVAVLCAGLLVTPGCTDQSAADQQAILAFLKSWYDEARNGTREDRLCHGLGLLKHPEVSCADMLASAASIDASTQKLESIKVIDCFAGVCGDLFEVRLRSQDEAGNELDETHILKRDEGQLRVYWYRNDKLINTLRADISDEPEEKDPVQQAYDKLKARYPELYQYPPCYGVRASSSTLVGELMPETAIDVETVHQLASECGDTFCFGLVGTKIAPLCPKS